MVIKKMSSYQAVSPDLASLSYRHIYHVIRKVCLVVLVGSCLAPFPAAAYTLQGPHVLDLMVREMSSAQTLRIDQQVILDDSSIADHPLELKETLSYAFPENFRSDTWFEDTKRIHVAASDQTLTIIDGRRTSNPVTPFERYKDLLLNRSRKLMHEKLLTYGVDVEKTSLGRFDGRIVYVVGAQYPDESVSQVMVDKESFLPLRWINVFSADPEDRLEFVYHKWQKRGDFWYPMEIETYHNHRLIRRIRVLKMALNAALPADTFDIAHLKATCPPAEPVGPSSPSLTPSSDEVQRMIEDFQKKFNKE